MNESTGTAFGNTMKMTTKTDTNALGRAAQSRRPWSDQSSWMLFFSNVFTVVLAVVERWDLSVVMWIYWSQSVIIGFFNCLRMLHLKQFSTEGIKMNDQPVPPTRRGQVMISGFFAVHYGFFHLVYLIFLAVNKKTAFPRQSAVYLAACAAVFLANHFFSYRHNLERDLARKPNIGTLMFFPYARIIPMHVTIIIGSLIKGSRGVLVLFLGLKTAADMIMHIAEHREKNGS